MTQFINMTEHTIRVKTMKGKVITFPASHEGPCKVILKKKQREIDGIEVISNVPYRIENMPEPRQGVLFIVSSIVLSYSPHRDDFVVPIGVKTDSHGKKLYCMGFARNIENCIVTCANAH